MFCDPLGGPKIPLVVPVLFTAPKRGRLLDGVLDALLLGFEPKRPELPGAVVDVAGLFSPKRPPPGAGVVDAVLEFKPPKILPPLDGVVEALLFFEPNPPNPPEGVEVAVLPPPPKKPPPLEVVGAVIPVPDPDCGVEDCPPPVPNTEDPDGLFWLLPKIFPPLGGALGKLNIEVPDPTVEGGC